MAQTSSWTRSRWLTPARLGSLLGVIVLALVAGALHRQWLPHAQLLFADLAARVKPGQPPPAAPAPTATASLGAATSIEMSEQARKNIGLTVGKVELQPFTRTIAVPGIVVERPGRSVVEVTAPLTGIILKIYAIEGEAVGPGQKLFDLRLTYEDLVQTQADLLQTAEELDVTAREIKRIEKLTEDGALAGKQLLDRKYEQQKQEAVLRSKRQALLLHGLTASQVDAILQRRELLRDLTVVAPATADDGRPAASEALFQVQSLKVAQGQHVTMGDVLASLADHAELYLEGEAFERDMSAISRAAEANSAVTAVLDTEGGESEVISGLRVLYLAAKVSPETRTLPFFATLPNEKQRDTRLADGRRIIAWRYRPGQRMELQIPVETLADRIVLPVGAVAQESAEFYVFTPNGNLFDRRSVHVEYRDTQWVVIANDGSLFPGDQVAVTGAQQLQLALKNQAGGGIDPHAGHNH